MESERNIEIDLLREIFTHPKSIDQWLSKDQINQFALVGLLHSLEHQDSYGIDPVLLMAARQATIEEIRTTSLDILIRRAIGNFQPAVDCLFQLAIEEDHPEIADEIISRGFSSSSMESNVAFSFLYGLKQALLKLDPDHIHISNLFISNPNPDFQARLIYAAQQCGWESWVAIIQAIYSAAPESLHSLVRLFPSFLPVDRELTLILLDGLAEKGSKEAQTAICQIFLFYESATALDLSLKKNYRPIEAIDQALFLFLSGQIQTYQEFDFNSQLLFQAYEAGDISLKKRLLEYSRYNGLTEWTTRLGGFSRQKLIQDMSEADWSSAIDQLFREKRYENCWQLAQFASPLWSVRIIKKLSSLSWTPTNPQDIEGWTILSSLATECSLKLPQPTCMNSTSIPDGNISASAVSKDGKLLTLGTSGPSIHFINIPKGTTEKPAIFSPGSQTRALETSLSNDILLTASGDNRLRLFRLSSGQVLKTLEGHSGLVKSLVCHPDGRSFISAGFDGTVLAWKLPEGLFAAKVLDLKNEIFSVGFDPTGKLLLSVGSDQTLSIWQWPSALPIIQLKGHSDTVICLSISQKGQIAATYSRDKTIRIWNFISCREVEKIVFDERSVTTISLSPDDHFLAAGTIDGSVILWDISTGSHLVKIAAHKNAIISISFTQEGKGLVTTSSDGSVKFWDLENFLLARTSIENYGGNILTSIDEKMQKKNEVDDKNWLSFISELIRWRRRFDIQLVSSHVIKLGEFDIEL